LAKCLLSESHGYMLADSRDNGLIVKETTFEFLPLHAVVEINPIPPETKVVPPSGGLNTKSSAVPDCATA
jgi:hypothetical protein